MYAHGRLQTLDRAHASKWTAAATEPWRIGLLRATGHPEQALELYERSQAGGWAHVWLHAMVGPEILIDLGRTADARGARPDLVEQLLPQGRELLPRRRRRNHDGRAGGDVGNAHLVHACDFYRM